MLSETSDATKPIPGASSRPKDVLVVCPQERDARAIEAAGLRERYAIALAGPDLDRERDFDPDAFLAATQSVPADGVVGTKDQSALVAALVAERRRLPGPRPPALLRCQHKPTSREVQRRAVPESTPRFALLGDEPPFEVPFFVKPVVGRLSQHAFRVEDPSQLARLPDADGSLDRYARIAALAGADPRSLRGFLAEEILTGREVTLEGYTREGATTTIGVTDSVKYPGTGSFERFEYPTTLAEDRRDELADAADRLVRALGFDGGFFNIEFVVPDRGPAKIVEVNARIASQFAPLVLALHGRSTYDALFALACGDDPAWQGRAPDGVAVSYVLRVFEDAIVEAVPDPEDEVEILVRPGLRLSEQGVNDVESFRLAIVYGAGETRAEALERCRARAQALTFRLRRLR
ncbi:MAG: ATP-grasp domain-containing protein [Actinomycetota bacterium]|nr:ATP-grasp domain-containing protein [Actinomycetota bacterium]